MNAQTLVLILMLTATWHGRAVTAGRAGTCAAPRDTVVAGRDTVTVHSRRGPFTASQSYRRWYPAIEDSARLLDQERFQHSYEVRPVWTGAMWVLFGGYCYDSVWVTVQKRPTSSTAPPPSCIVWKPAAPR